MRMKLLYVALFGAAVASSIFAWHWFDVVSPEAMANARYVGSLTCAECHQR
jgi:hypothetical protein